MSLLAYGPKDVFRRSARRLPFPRRLGSPCAPRRRGLCGPVLSAGAPDTSKKPILITTPIFYVNGEPHIGHLYSVLLADALARWHRVLGHPTKMVTGTDEHGIKVQQAAEAQGRDPMAFCDKMTTYFVDLWKRANIQVDEYVRTTEPRHVGAVTEMWKRLTENGQLYKGTFEGWYSVSDESFLTDTQVADELSPSGTPTGKKISLESGNSAIWVAEENYKFRLSNYQNRLIDWIQKQCPIYPMSKSEQILSELQREKFGDLSVSRLSRKVKWGIPVPGDSEHVIYVWIDALTSYLTACGFPHSSEPSPSFWPADYHILGKDILKFHAIYWPALLLATSQQLPRRLIVHAHWTKNKKKIAKSTGNVVDPNEIISRHGVNEVRFFLLRQGGISDDGDYNDDDLNNLVSATLVDSLGNLITRCISSSLNPSCQWPTLDHNNLTDHELGLVRELNQLVSEVDSLYKTCEFGLAIHSLFVFLAKINGHFTRSEPWNLVKQPSSCSDTSQRLNSILYISLESVRIVSLLLQPVIPGKTDEFLEYLGIPADHRNPVQWRFGYNYRSHSSKPSIPKHPFVMFDHRQKKKVKFELKQRRKVEAASP
ncbi:probable methionine--tRNA ligase, mitochondrial [Schistocerca gregaria]|uniref:probable methionine--tRNA ligase, mitochondrial n=1 Tax=Schistocerca gregaria TaxID=7010 RepID=UPI00211F2449|nr:probable methionine--tRNA ligase, mitochondrial [Schistocerca gregaria]